MKIKQISTGDNDSIEDVMIAIMNVKTEDGKFVGYKEAWKEVERAWKRLPYGIGFTDHGGE